MVEGQQRAEPVSKMNLFRITLVLQVLVVSDVKKELGYSKNSGHRAWRNICQGLKAKAHLVEVFDAKVNGKVESCLGFVENSSPPRVEQPRTAVYVDEVSVEETQVKFGKSKTTDQLVELPVDCEDQAVLKLLVQILLRLSEADPVEMAAMYGAPAKIENLIEVKSAVAGLVCGKTKLLKRLMSKIKVKELEVEERRKLEKRYGELWEGHQVELLKKVEIEIMYKELEHKHQKVEKEYKELDEKHQLDMLEKEKNEKECEEVGEKYRKVEEKCNDLEEKYRVAMLEILKEYNELHEKHQFEQKEKLNVKKKSEELEEKMKFRGVLRAQESKEHEEKVKFEKKSQELHEKYEFEKLENLKNQNEYKELMENHRMEIVAKINAEKELMACKVQLEDLKKEQTDAKDTNILVEVWRYYLLTNRPEVSDTLFTWADLQAKLNNELLNNLGNFINRVLSFVAKPSGQGYDSFVPDAPNAVSDPLTEKIAEKVGSCVEPYVEAMEKVKLKQGLKIAMSISSEGNAYLQESQFWKLYKEDQPRCSIVMRTAVGLVHLLACLLEPFMPSFSVGVFKQLNLPHETHTSLCDDKGDIDRARRPWEIVPKGHKIGKPETWFKDLSDDEVESLRKKFAGSQANRKKMGKIMKLLLKVKNGTPPQRKTTLRKITDKAGDLGAGSLLNRTLPLLMQPTLEGQDMHLLVKSVCHVALIQGGHCKPGEMLLGTDSHNYTTGAFGQFATGIGNTDAGATYKVMELGGITVKSSSMEERMSLCNMVVEAGKMVKQQKYMRAKFEGILGLGFKKFQLKIMKLEDKFLIKGEKC